MSVKSGRQRGKRVTLASTLTAALAAGAWLLAGGTAATAVAQGDPCPNADIRSQQNAEFPPDCRAYEQASPIDKNGGHVGVGTGVGARPGALVSPDGNRVMYTSKSTFPGSLAADITNGYVSARSGGGWQTFPVSAPFTFKQTVNTSLIKGSSRDLSKQFVSTNDALAPGAVQGDRNGYIYDSSAGTYEYAGTIPNTLGNNFFFHGGSDDGSSVFFFASTPLDSTPAPVGDNNLYELANGELKLVGILPDGTVVDNTLPARHGGNASSSDSIALNRVSRDGSRVYWNTGDVLPAKAIYLREDGETVLVTERESDGSTQAANFGHATPDGDYAFIYSDDRLTDDASPGVNEEHFVTVGGGATGGTFTLSFNRADGTGSQTTAPIAWDASAAAVQSALEALSNVDAGNVSVTGAAGGPWTVEFTGSLGGTDVFTLGKDASGLTPSGTVTVTVPVVGAAPLDLYRYDAEADELTNLTPTAAGELEGVEGVLGVSEDGSYVYFQATSDLAPGATEGEHNIYAWHDGEIRLVATSASGLEHVGTGASTSGSNDPRDAWGVSPDGSHLGIVIDGALTGPNPQPAQPFRTAYLYSYGDDSLDCASCPPGGDAPTGDVGLEEEKGTTFDLFTSNGLAHRVLDDGSFFFVSPDPLVAGDANGDALDVYQYRAGELYLISTGQSPEDSFLGNVTADGSSVFVLTLNQLAGQDQDALYDYYSARVNGGLASQNPPPEDPPCQGDECQGEKSGAPADTGTDTDKSGSGNPEAIDRERCQKLERKATNTKKRSKKLAKKAKKLKKKARKANGKKKSKRLKKKARKKTKKSRKQAQKSRKFVLRAVKCRGGSQ